MSGTDSSHTGSFAEGERTLPHTEGDDATGHFAEGQEDHDALANVRGSFAEGELTRHAEHERTGSYGDVDCPVCRAISEAGH